MEKGKWKAEQRRWEMIVEGLFSNLHSPISILHSPISILQSPFSIFQRQRGSSLVEMALTLPVILLLLLGTLDLGRAVYAQNVITNAAREGARYGAIVPGDTQAIQNRVESSSVGLDQNALSIAIDTTAETIRVTVTYQFTTITPFVGNFLGPGGTVTLQGMSTMEIEGSQ